MCDVGRNEAPIGHQVHHNRIPHIPANKTFFLFIYITNNRLMTCSYELQTHMHVQIIGKNLLCCCKLQLNVI